MLYDARLISAARSTLSISCYHTLKTWAEELGMRDALMLLDEMLQEEKRIDAISHPARRATRRSAGGLNAAAA